MNDLEYEAFLWRTWAVPRPEISKFINTALPPLVPRGHPSLTFTRPRPAMDRLGVDHEGLLKLLSDRKLVPPAKIDGGSVLWLEADVAACLSEYERFKGK